MTYQELKLKCITDMIALIIAKINSTEWNVESIYQCGDLIENIADLKRRQYRISTDNSEKYTVHRFGSIDYLFIGTDRYQLNQDGTIVYYDDNHQSFATVYMYGSDGCHLWVAEDTNFVDSLDNIPNMTWACRPAWNNGEDALFANINGEIIFLE